MSVHYIDTDTALESVCTRIKTSRWIALDTEFMRQDTYYPILCLIQIATPDLIACIDPIAIKNNPLILDILFDQQQLKIVHSGSQDLEVLFQLTGKTPHAIFDTQIAASMLGYGEQISYAALVQQLTGVELSKTQTRTDWARRPLAPEQLYYAADDVRHLHSLYLQLEKMLHEKNRDIWMLEESQKLTDPSVYLNDPETAWLRIKGLQHLTERDLPTAQALAAWREKQAQRSNRPRKWIISDTAILDISQQKPSSVEALSKTRDLPAGVVKNHAKTLLECVKNARDLPGHTLADLKPCRILDSLQKKQLKKIQLWLTQQAETRDIPPTLLATRRDLENLVSGNHNIPLLSGWRYQLLGHAALAMVQSAAE